jgi:hypothetical protein
LRPVLEIVQPAMMMAARLRCDCRTGDGGCRADGNGEQERPAFVDIQWRLARNDEEVIEG